MSKITKEIVDKSAEEILIDLTSEEIENIIEKIESIDESFESINLISNIKNIEPMTHCLDDFTVELRDDEAEESDSIEDLLKNSDETTYREVELPKVVG